MLNSIHSKKAEQNARLHLNIMDKYIFRKAKFSTQNIIFLDFPTINNIVIINAIRDIIWFVITILQIKDNTTAKRVKHI